MTFVRDTFHPTYDLVAIIRQSPPVESPIIRPAENEPRTEWGIVIAVGPGVKDALARDNPLPFKEGDVVLYNVKNCEKVQMPSALVYVDEDRPSTVPVTYVRAPNIYMKLSDAMAMKWATAMAKVGVAK